MKFAECETLGAINLRGTRFASESWELRSISASIDGKPVEVNIRVVTLPGYLLAKIHAAYARTLEKDWYDIAYVLINNDAGGPSVAGAEVRNRFGKDLIGSTRTALIELSANFADNVSQGSMAYADAMLSLHPELDYDIQVNDAVAAVAEFTSALNFSR